MGEQEFSKWGELIGYIRMPPSTASPPTPTPPLFQPAWGLLDMKVVTGGMTMTPEGWRTVVMLMCDKLSHGSMKKEQHGSVKPTEP